MSESTDSNASMGLRDAIRKIQRDATLPRYDERSLLISKGEVTGDPLVDMFFEDPISQFAYDLLTIRYTETRRIYIEACLLASSNFEKIADLLDVEEELVEAYSKIYFDVSDLDRLDKLRIIETVEDQREQQLKLWALSQGLDFISWRLGQVPRISPVEGLTSLFSDCFFKAKEAFYNSNSADPSKEGLKWAKQGTDIARLLKSWVSDADEATRDIRIALEEITGDDMIFPDMEDLEDGEDIELAYVRDSEEEDSSEDDDPDSGDFGSIDDLNKEEG